MKKKIIIAIAVIIIAVVAYLLYTKNAASKAEQAQLQKDYEDALKAAGNGYWGSVYTDDTRENPSTDPQKQLSHAKDYYVNVAAEIFGLFDGFTSDEEEEAVKALIRKCVQTDADWEELCMCYGTDSSGMGLVQRCYDEDISREQLNKILQNAGCTIRV